MYNFAVSRIPASKAAAFTNLIPVFAVLMGRFILSETLTPTQYLAAALTLGGVVLSQTGGSMSGTKGNRQTSLG